MKLLIGGWGSPDGARAGRASGPGVPMLGTKLVPSVSAATLPVGFLPSSHATLSCLVPAVVASHPAGSWAVGGKSPSPPLQFCSGGLRKLEGPELLALLPVVGARQLPVLGSARCFPCHPCPSPPWLVLKQGLGLILSQGLDPCCGVPLHSRTLAVP